MTLRGAFEDAQRASAALGGRLDIHFDGEARAALRELRGEFDFRGFAIGLFFGVLFRRSGNLWMVAVIHGIGNAYIITSLSSVR